MAKNWSGVLQIESEGHDPGRRVVVLPVVVVLVDSVTTWLDVDVSIVVVVLSVTVEVSDDVDVLTSVEDEVEESVTGIVDGLISVEDDVESGVVVGDAVVESVDDGTTVVPK